MRSNVCDSGRNERNTSSGNGATRCSTAIDGLAWQSYVSGSPVIDKKGELVGLIFDGNIESLPGNYFYDEKVNRGVAVDARAILHALDKVYGATGLVAELTGK